MVLFSSENSCEEMDISFKKERVALKSNLNLSIPLLPKISNTTKKKSSKLCLDRPKNDP